jgi:hypothetical protein
MGSDLGLLRVNRAPGTVCAAEAEGEPAAVHSRDAVHGRIHSIRVPTRPTWPDRVLRLGH